MSEINTERLTLRNIRADDAEQIYRCWANDEETTKYLTWRPHESPETTKNIVAMWLEDYLNPDCLRYGIEIAGTDALIGMIDVVAFKENCPEIGYVLDRQYWNKGYMTEAFGAVIRLLFEKGYPAIVIEADERNVGSNAVIRKCGFRFVKKETRLCSKFKPEAITVNWYKLER